MQLPFCVYILFSELDHQLYIGYSSDIVKRIKQHDSGQNISTKHRRPWKLIFIEYYLFKVNHHTKGLPDITVTKPQISH